VNNGLLPIECDTGGIADGDGLVILAGHDAVRVENRTRASSSTGIPFRR
jgi:hypothetical protein